MKNSNNNQKYIAKAALFLPYALATEKSERELSPIIKDVMNYMTNFPEIKMLGRCVYIETKNGSIAKLTDHIDYLDRWQLEDDLKQKKVAFLVIPTDIIPEDESNDYVANIHNVFESGIDLFDVDAHDYYNPIKDEDEKLCCYFENRFEAHCRRVVSEHEINEDELDKLAFGTIYACLLVPLNEATESFKDYLGKCYEKAQLLSINNPEIFITGVVCENRRGDIVGIEPVHFERDNYYETHIDRYADLWNGTYDVIVVPSMTVLESSPFFQKWKYTLLYNAMIIYSLEDNKGICSEILYTEIAKNE